MPHNDVNQQWWQRSNNRASHRQIPFDGFTTRRAYDGEEGLRVMRENPPDLLLLDLAMPDVGGFQVLDKMHQEAALAGVRVILLTATGYADDIAAARSTRLTIHRTDGFYPAEICAALKRLLMS